MFNTRIAPSPSGNFHIGTARTAYFNWLAARSTNGKFVLRIDDTNQEKVSEEYIKVIYETMNWLGLDYDVTFRQFDRVDRYKQIAEDLVKCDKAFRDDNGAILLSDIQLPLSWTDEISGEIKITVEDYKAANNMVVLRANGIATYPFATVVDDIDYDINFVIRGTDHISNTARQIALFNVLGKKTPKFAHVGLIHYQGKKLAKREGAASCLFYKERGYDNDAMLNFLLRLGWGPYKDDKSTAVIDKERALQMFFQEGKMKSASANMDLGKLEAYDRKYKARKGIWRNKAKLVEENHA